MTWSKENNTQILLPVITTIGCAELKCAKEVGVLCKYNYIAPGVVTCK